MEGMSAWWAQPTVVLFGERDPCYSGNPSVFDTATLYVAAGTIHAQNVWGMFLTRNPESEPGELTGEQELPKWVPLC